MGEIIPYLTNTCTHHTFHNNEHSVDDLLIKSGVSTGLTPMCTMSVISNTVRGFLHSKHVNGTGKTQKPFVSLITPGLYNRYCASPGQIWPDNVTNNYGMWWRGEQVCFPNKRLPAMMECGLGSRSWLEFLGFSMWHFLEFDLWGFLLVPWFSPLFSLTNGMKWNEEEQMLKRSPFAILTQPRCNYLPYIINHRKSFCYCLLSKAECSSSSFPVTM